MIIFVTCIPHICNFFSTYTIFGSIFSTQMCVNRYKTDYSKNSVNCQKTDFTTRNRVNFRFLHICIVEKFEIPPNLAKFLISPHLFCENLKFCYIWRNLRFQHICHVLKSEIPPHDQFFLHLYQGDIGDKYGHLMITMLHYDQHQGTIFQIDLKSGSSNVDNHLRVFSPLIEDL